MTFPDIIKIQIVNKTKEQIRLPGVIVFITLFQKMKNNYNLGPFFTNAYGIIELKKSDLIIAAEAVLASGLMDYADYSECSEDVTVKIFDHHDLDKLLNARTKWGLLGQERILYETKTKLLERIKSCNNHLLEPSNILLKFNGQSLLEAKLVSSLI